MGLIAIGLGDTLKKITSFFGVSSCTSCKKRQELLNRWFPYNKVITVVVNTDMYDKLYPRGSVITVDKDHFLYRVAPILLERGDLIPIHY